MKKQLKKRDFTKIHVNGKPLEVLQVLGIEVPVWRDPEREDVLVLLKPVVEQLGLRWSGQHRKLKQAHPVYADTIHLKWIVYSHPLSPKKEIQQEALFIARKGFLFWLARLDTSRTSTEKRALIERFHAEVADVLDRYFAEGVAVNPTAVRAAPQQVAKSFASRLSEILSPEKKAEMLLKVADLLDESKYRNLLGRILAAELTGHAEFLPAPQDLPVDLTTWARDRLSREGISLPYEKLRIFGQGMGQRAAQLYKAHFGEPPEKRTQEVGGVVRPINAYYLPKHEGILEEAFRKTLQDWRDKRKL